MGNKIEIGFGTVFTVNSSEYRTDLIIDPGKGNDFFSVRVIKKEDEYVVISLPGTGRPIFIKEEVERLTLDQVCKAAEKGLIVLGYEKMFEPLKKSFEENAKKPTRIINLP